MNKKLVFFAFFTLAFSSLFAKEIVLERHVENKVQRYYKGAKKVWFEEHGNVKLYVKEFSNADGTEKFGWAYKIDTAFLNDAEEKDKKGLRDEDDSPLMYYVCGGRFYIGWLFSNGYTTEVTKTHVFYDFDEKDGYELYFMFAYACAVNSLLTYGNHITFKEAYNKDGKGLFYTNDSENEVDKSFYWGNFPSYREYAKPRTEYRTLRMNLVKDAKSKSSIDAGNKIAANLKEHGLWKAKRPMYSGDGCSLGEMGPNEGVITCWYEPFKLKSWGDDYEGLAEMTNKSLLIDFKPVKVYAGQKN